MSQKSRAGQFRFKLTPEENRAYTRWRIEGSVPTTPTRRWMRQLLQDFAFWSGWPVQLALPVARDTAAWLEWWVDTLCDIPEDHLQLYFVPEQSERKAVADD